MSDSVNAPLKPPATGIASSAAARCDAWYTAFGTAVYRYVRFHVDSADEADDVTADTFLRVLEAGDRYDPERADVRAWIFTIARNVLRDHFRRARVRKHVTLSAMRDLAAGAPSPEERLVREEQIERLLRGVRHLKDADRELISLRYGSDLGFAKIGEVLGMREGAVRTRLWRALARLREHLEADPA
ncbi:MAG TPA: sigma-70 family RNA polymerase sigma factor [Gemmatimonadales bacterium]|nr:sigma-70 family RNA polymerase sigma factor [Gemmatimonadales bacterium]